MAEKKTLAPPQGRTLRDPFALFRQITSELDELDRHSSAATRWPLFRRPLAEGIWAPEIDVFERDNRLVTKVDLPGLKKEDVKVEVSDGYLSISGERKGETEETGDTVYRRERSYGSFYRAVPLPEGAKLEDVDAIFADGVLEVSVPVPAKAQTRTRTVHVEEGAQRGKGAVP